MRLVFFTLTGLIVSFNWRFPIGTHRSSASHACNRAADHFIVQPCPYAVGVVIDRAVFTNTEVLRRLDGINISAEEQEFPTILPRGCSLWSSSLKEPAVFSLLFKQYTLRSLEYIWRIGFR